MEEIFALPANGVFSNSVKQILGLLRPVDGSQATRSPQVETDPPSSLRSFVSQSGFGQNGGREVSSSRMIVSSNDDIESRTEKETREYASSVDTLTPPRKWVQWCVGTRKVRLHEIWVEDNNKLKSGCQFIQELQKSYRRIRGLRWWFSLSSLAEVKIVKACSLLPPCAHKLTNADRSSSRQPRLGYV